MEIAYNKQRREFFLSNARVSYACAVISGGELAHLYFGPAIARGDTLSYVLQTRDQVPITPARDGFYPDLLPYEYPVYGRGDFREPAIVVRGEDGSRISDFSYQDHRIIEGKPPLPGLPASRVSDRSDAMTLEIDLLDELRQCCLTLRYSVFEDQALIVRSASLRNEGAPVVIERMLSASFDYRDSGWEALYLAGQWGREAQATTRPLAQGRFVIDSKRGSSSAVVNPFLALKRPQTGEHEGEAYAFNLVYSGNFVAQAEVDGFRSLRVGMGLNPFDFSWTLDTGECFCTPEVVAVYSGEGLNAMSQSFHHFYRKHLIREQSRPVLLNSWEAMYFDFDEKSLLNMADAAQELGVELFVLDDGWFGARNDDTTSLGDWHVNRDKLPDGIDALAKAVAKKGMRFGIWIEPEMVSKESDLYRAHPEWLLQVPGRSLTASRNQHVLDLSNREVVEHLFSVLHDLLDEGSVSYVKWDMNRCMTEAGSPALPAHRQKEVPHRYMLGLYELLDRLVRAFPDVLFEFCASGGNRFDPGMMCYMSQGWTSDSTDAVARLAIQHGVSLAYPLSVVGSHVSSVPNHQTGRIASLKFRGDVSLFGVLGYELDPRSLDAGERSLLREQIARYKRHRTLLHEGRFFRLESPADRTGAAWMVLNDDASEALAGWYVLLVEPNPPFFRLKLTGLVPTQAYELRVEGAHDAWFEDSTQTDMGASYTGAELVNIGYPIPYPKRPLGDFLSLVVHLKARQPAVDRA